MKQRDTIRRSLSFIVALLLIPAFAVAQPTIDGDISGDSDYIKLAEWTQDDGSGFNTGFGPHGMLELHAYRNSNTLYVAIVGESENNGNAFLLFIDVSSQSGIPSGTSLPGSSDGLSPFNGYGTQDGGATHDFETDFGARIGVSDDGTQAENPAFFASFIDYRSLNTNGNAEETFFSGPNSNSTWPADGSVASITTSPWDGTEMAYDDVDEISNVTTEAWEVAIPLSKLGATAGDTFKLFALYTSGSGNFISANTLPEIPGQGGTSLGSPGSFSFVNISGDQHTSASTLPVELSAFDAATDGQTARLTWTTASETNNAGFAIQHAAPGAGFERVGWKSGAGTTAESRRYTFEVDGLSAGTHRFRLKQVDQDGTPTLSDVVKARVDLKSRMVMTGVAPNPVRGQATLQIGVKDAQPVTVELYNLLGQKVRTLHRGTLQSGQMKTIDVNTSDLSSGVYVVRAQGASFSKTQRMTVVR
jgi:hypothetical protein